MEPADVIQLFQVLDDIQLVLTDIKVLIEVVYIRNIPVNWSNSRCFNNVYFLLFSKGGRINGNVYS